MLVPQVEALLASEDYGKDLASVNNLLKKHQLLEADISAHEVTTQSWRPASGSPPGGGGSGVWTISTRTVSTIKSQRPKFIPSSLLSSPHVRRTV